MRLSKRLQSVAGLAGVCGTVADVGTDHGYIPVFLVGSKKADYAIAMDVNPGPLRRAKEHIAAYGMEHQIEARLSDGLSALSPGEADTVVIAGMGGSLMMRILSQGEGVAMSARKLVLQPQSEIQAFREFLYEHGYRMAAEDMVWEDGKYYPMMAVQPVWEGRMDPASWMPSGLEGIAARIVFRYGPLLLQQGHPVLRQYLLQQQKQKQGILTHFISNARQDSGDRAAELRRELEDIEEALRIVRGAGA